MWPVVTKLFQASLLIFLSYKRMSLGTSGLAVVRKQLVLEFTVCHACGPCHSCRHFYYLVWYMLTYKFIVSTPKRPKRSSHWTGEMAQGGGGGGEIEALSGKIW